MNLVTDYLYSRTKSFLEAPIIFGELASNLWKETTIYVSSSSDVSALV